MIAQMADGGLVFRRVLETLCEPVIVLSTDRIVQFTNAAARTVLNGSEGLVLRGNVLVAGKPEVQARLAAALLNIATTATESMLLKQREDGRCSVLHLSRLSPGKAGLRAAPHAVRVLATVCVNAALPDVQTLRQAFGLSHAEAEIALLIAGGYSPRRIASKRDSTEATVRWHIKNIYSKTYTTRLVDLVIQLAAARSPFFAGPVVRHLAAQADIPPSVPVARRGGDAQALRSAARTA